MALISNGDQVLTKRVYGTNETLLFSSDTPTDVATLSEALSNFETVKIMFSINGNCHINEFCTELNDIHKNIVCFGNARDSFAWAKQNIKFEDDKITITDAWSFVGLNANNYDANNNIYAKNSIGKIWGVNRKEDV